MTAISAACQVIEQDAELMCQVREGDSYSYALLLERYQKPVIRFMRRLVQNEGVAEDLAQEVFLRIYCSRARYEPTAKFATWLFRIATHVAINWLRSGKQERIRESLDYDFDGRARREFPDRNPTAEEHLLENVKAREIRQAIDALPENQRTAVVLHKYQELEYSEIARVLNCSDAAVKSLLFRAYERLRLRLAHLGG